MAKIRSDRLTGLENVLLKPESSPLIPESQHAAPSEREQHPSKGLQPRMMTPEEEAKWGPMLDSRKESALNRARFDPAVLAQYKSELIAWSPDGTRIIAHADDDETIFQLLDEAGEDPSLCLVQYLGGDTEV